jgi:alkanesulfonate monooxygenase
VELCIFTEPQQGATYDDLVAVAKTTEAAGFHGFFRSDHYLKMGNGSGLPGPTHAWVTLAGLARETTTIRLGTLVSPITFHDPGPLAIMVAQVDAMSGGRIDFGVGSGWFEAEHDAYGLHFGSLDERMTRFEEAIGHIVGLWTTPEELTYNSDGPIWSFSESPALPKPHQRPHPPIIIGGRGKKRTPALVAKYAAEFNLPFVPEAEKAEVVDRVFQACADHGRADVPSVSAALVVCAGADDAETERRAATLGRDTAELRENGVAGSPAEIIDKIVRYADAGVSRIYLQVLDLHDLDHIAFIGSEIRPHV